VRAIAFETVRTANGALPLLQPMSEIAGRMAVQEGAKYLEKSMGGRGVLLSGAPGVARGSVVILGAGMVGKNAAKIAVGLNADVTVLDVNHSRLEYVDDIFGGRVKTLASTRFSIREAARAADILIGAVLIPGARAPRLVPRSLVRRMNPGSVIVDVAVDQGGCVETIRPTYHSRPTYVVDGVIHYGVANMPGGVPRTSTFALSNAILPYTLELANLGAAEAVRAFPELAEGLNAAGGRITHPAVAGALGMKCAKVEEVF
jgi:alanine dehydrogenase